MRWKPKEERRHSALRLSVLFLCVSIFSWGLHVKLQGYKTPERSHSRPVAKLVQDDPAAKRLILSESLSRRGDLLASAAVATLTVAPRLVAQEIVCQCEPARSSLAAFAYALRFRPPPSASLVW
jgi:hypothetical protein